MIHLTCNKCGASNFKEENNKYICVYCHTPIIKASYDSKKRLHFIIILLIIIFITLLLSYKFIYKLLQNNYLSQLQQTNKTKTTSNDESNIPLYHLTVSHPSSNISSGSNKVYLSKSFLKNSKLLNRKMIYEFGTFTSSVHEYTIKYNYIDKPPFNYDTYGFYNNSQFKGIPKYPTLYLSTSLSELISKIEHDISTKSCQKWAANTHGNLHRDDNFWTLFCPKPNLLIHLKEIQNTLNSKNKVLH